MQTAESLLVLAATLIEDVDGRGAGAVRDGPKDESLAKLLLWLRRWKKGDFGAEGQGRRAGGGRLEVVSRLGEILWLDVLDEHLDEIDLGWLAGGRRSKKASHAEGEAKLVNIHMDEPFDGEVGGRVEDWLEANLTGDKAMSTARIYAGAWSKWKAWVARQGLISEYLPTGKDKVQENENKLLSYLGYLGWLGVSASSMKQAASRVCLERRTRAGRSW